MMKHETVLHCPVCHNDSDALMPDDACVVVYPCPQCGALLRPKPGDCCVFCSYADDLCPPEQTRTARE